MSDSIAAGRDGFKIIGENLLDRAGDRLASAGDVNGDGLDDIFVSASQNHSGAKPDGSDTSQPGATDLVFGKSDTAPINVDRIPDLVIGSTATVDGQTAVGAT